MIVNSLEFQIINQYSTSILVLALKHVGQVIELFTHPGGPLKKVLDLFKVSHMTLYSNNLSSISQIISKVEHEPSTSLGF